MSPIECSLLDGAPVPFGRCPRVKCDKPFYPFMRGQVQRDQLSWWAWPPWTPRDYCAVICSECKEIVGWESPATVGRGQR